MNEVCFVGDRSGSMDSMGDAPWEGARDWANEQAEEAMKNGHDTRITVVAFDDNSERVIDSASTAYWTKINNRDAREWMRTRGCTRLYDTAIEELRRLRERMTARGTECQGVFAIFTDGYDNRSVATAHDLNQAVQEAQKAGVTCFFLAANQDAIASGQKYGFNSNNCLSSGADPMTSRNAFRAMSSAVTRSTNGCFNQNGLLGFTDTERMQSVPRQNSLFGQPQKMNTYHHGLNTNAPIQNSIFGQPQKMNTYHHGRTNY